MTFCRSKVSRRANLVLVPLMALLLSSVGHAAPPTAITTCAFNIATPGQYYLAMDLTCPGSGISIRTNGVYLRLDGHTLQGSSAGPGILVGCNDIVIQGPGTITGFQDSVSYKATSQR